MLDVRFEWDRGGSPELTIKPNLKTIDKKIMLYTAAIFRREELIAQAYMKQNAPWTDRTGNARSGLKATSQSDVAQGKFRLILYHSVPYGIWLEIKNQGRYRIIQPSVKHSGEHLMSLFAKMLEKMGGVS